MNMLTSSRMSWRLLLVMTVMIAGFAIFQGRAFIFGPAVMETGDFAANALLIVDARSFTDIYGNYSRWGFNHPGPFFFYVYAAGEWLFRDMLHMVTSPHQAHVLAGILLQSLLLGTAIALLAAGVNRRLAAPLMLATAAIVLLHANNAVSSIWMPHVLLGPYVVLIVACAFVAQGNVRHLPLATLMVCILCHGHVAQPLMSVPLLLAAIVVHIRWRRAAGAKWLELWKESTQPLLISGAIIAVFLVPIVVDLLRCPDCNAKRIVDYMTARHAGERPNSRQAVNSIAAFFMFEHNPEVISEMPRISWFTPRIATMLAWVAVSMAATTLVARRRGDGASALLRTCLRFALFALLLSCIWARRITGPLYEFNSYFVYGIIFVMAATTLGSLILLAERINQDRRMVAIGWVAMIALTACSPHPAVFSATNVAVDDTSSADRSYAGRFALLNQNENEDWAGMTALAIWAYRTGGDYASPREWAYVFGWSHAFDAAKARAAGPHMDIWEPGKSRDPIASRHFSPGDYCRISSSSQEPAVEGDPQPLSAPRSACTLTAFGLGKVNGDPLLWTTSQSVFMQMRGRRVPSFAVIRLLAEPYLGDGRLERQRVVVRVNGDEVETLSYTASSVQEVKVPAAIWNERDVETIELSFPDATSPVSLGVSGDPRVLGIRVLGLGMQYQ